MRDKRMLMDEMLNQIRGIGGNVFGLALYHRGEWELGAVTQASPAQNCYSVTKSFTSTAIGILWDEGKIALDAPILSFFAGELPARLDPRMERVTVRHLLTHTTGLETGFLFEADRFGHGTDDWASLCLSQPLPHEPGAFRAYSNSNYYLLSCIAHRITGATLDEFARSKLFAPLKIEDYAWTACPRGETSGATGLYISAQDMAKLAVMYMHGGQYEGRRVVSEEWSRMATTEQEPGSGSSFSISVWDGGFSYGGAYEQIVLAYPPCDLALGAHAFASGIPYAELFGKAIEASAYER
ncbi:MAG: beta-lactamase family protein [Clostridiales bacterium]|nr:beta-lactamase family protein [Clostridiales bacterium]